MDHRYIKEHLIADSYLLGRLSEEEEERFEAHFIDCEECLERLERIEDFRRALHQVAAEEMATRSASSGASWFGWLAQLSRPRQVALLVASLLLLAALPAALFVPEVRRLRRELAQASLASQLPVQSLNSDPRQPSIGPEKKESPTDEPSRLMPPQINTPIFTLSAERSAGRSLARAVNEITVSSTPALIVFSLELESKLAYKTYRATIFTADGRRLWQESGLQPNRYDALTITFNSTFFSPGSYLLTLAGLTPAGQPVAVVNYPFRVIPKNP